MASIGLRLEPLDTLFFRDGRPFDGQPRAMSGLPQPQTLAGALRTWLLRQSGCDFEKLGSDIKGAGSFAEALKTQCKDLASVAGLTFRGPWLARSDRPLVPVPAILRRIKDSAEIVRLAPLRDPLPGWQPPAPGMRPLWWRGREPTERIEGYLTLDGLRSLVDGQTPSADDIVPASDLYDFDRRTGIVVGAETHTSPEGQIYGVSLLALKQGVSFYAEIVGDAQVSEAEAVIPFGGEGRRVRLTRADRPCDWPSARSENGRTMLVLTAPAPFGGGWPEWLNPVAAAVPGHVAVSGWDLARGGPKPNRFAVAAGSVYFLDQPLQHRSVAGSLCDGEDAAIGWGTTVEGPWDDA